MSEEKVLTLRGKKAVWAPAPAGGGVGGTFVVTVTSEDGENFTADKSFTEIEAAIEAGQCVHVCLKSGAYGIWCNLAMHIAGLQVDFVGVQPSSNEVNFTAVNIGNNNAVVMSSIKCNTATAS